MGVPATLALFAALLAAMETLHRRLQLDGELSRKLVHMASALLAACLSFILTPRQIAVLGVGFAAAMLVSRRFALLRSVHSVTRATQGEVLFPLGVGLLAVIARDRPTFVYGVLVLGIADGMAALVGGRFGRRKVRVPLGEKSIWGSATFFVIAAVLGAMVLTAQGQTLPTVLEGATVAAAVLTATELGLGGGLDNLMLPLVAALVISL
jgi:phytol kinase